MRGSKAYQVHRTDRAHILPPRKRRPSLNGGGQGVHHRSLVIALAMILLVLGTAYSALPATQHNLSPAGPTHASLCDGSAGEGPTSDTRTTSDGVAFLDVITEGARFSGAAGEPSDMTFTLNEHNNVGLTIETFSWNLRTLDNVPVTDGSGNSRCSIDIPAMGTTEWTTSITITEELYRDMMVSGRDQLRLTVTLKGVDGNGNDIIVSRTVPAYLTQKVAMLVDEDVYPLIKDNLARYERDVNLRGSVEFVYRTGNWGSAKEIRSLLKQLWRDEGITGVILWGYLPFAMWDMVHSDDSHEIFPIPVFYEDMDGSFADTNGDGLYDKHYWGENDGCEIWASFVMPPRELVPEENLDPSGLGTGGGLQASYYNSRNQGNWRMSRVDPTLDFYWQEDLPGEIDDDDFSVKWTGRIRADASETYTLSPLHGGGLRIWIDGNLVHDEWDWTTWKKWEHMSTVYMTKGWHDIRIEYNNNNWGFDGAVRLLWTSDHVLAGTINDWLDRSHAYHQGSMEYHERALLFLDYGYGIKYNLRDSTLNGEIKPIYGDNVVVKGCTNTTAADDYIRALEDGHELISVWSHAGSAGHWISYQDKPDDVNGTAPSYKIRETRAGLVTLIWGCHAGDFGGGHEGEDVSFLSDNLAANYAFSTPYGLACAAATRSIGTKFKEVYWAWDNGSSLATGFSANLEVEYDRETIERKAPNIAEDMWVKDVVLMGDPFIRIDHRPWNVSMTIDDGAGYTTDSTVLLHVSAFDAEEMRFMNAGGDWSNWEDFQATKEWTIGESYGGHRVRVQVRNGWGRTYYSAYDVITRIATLPDRVSLEIEGGAEMTNSTVLEITLDIGRADPELVWMNLRDDDSEWSGWEPFQKAMIWILSPGDGERTVTARFLTDDGLWSMNASDSILVDTRPPVTDHVVTGEMGALGWYVSTVTVELNAMDDVSGVKVIHWSLDGSEWATYSGPIPINGDGHHKLRYASIDLCGNEEDGASVDLKMDMSGPTDLTVLPTDGSVCLNLPSIDLTLIAWDPMSGIDAMRFAVDDDDWGPWTEFTTNRIMVLPDQEGQHSIGWQVKDAAGNVGTLPEPLLLELDTTSPGVESVYPEHGSTGVPVDTAITLTFDEPIDVATLTSSNLLVQDETGGPVNGELAYSEDTRTATFVPDDLLDHLTSYSIMVRGEVRDVAGNGLEGGSGHLWSFETEGLPPGPPTGLSAIATNDSIVLTWDAPENLGTGDLTGYNVYRMMDDGSPGNDFTFFTSVVGNDLEDDDVDVSIQYHYMVRALTSFSEGDDSQVVSAIVVPVDDGPDEPDGPETPGPDERNESPAGDDGGSWYVTLSFAAVIVTITVLSGTALVLRKRRA
jgi:hypothetical protein